jgi:serine/threonine-protein kinase
VKTAEPTSPEEFGPYLVYERLGVGGMATVHRAKKRGIAGFERGVALKRMLPHLADDAEFIQSFVREAKLASLLVHPNIAQIYDFGRVGAVYYIAMEHVDGFDVRKMLRYSNRHKEPLPLPVVLSILSELCDALEYAHTFVDEHGMPQGIVHRDVSPSNLIVAHSGHLKVIDFGIAKANARQLHTESGRVKGKLGYMSPEAVSGRAYGPVSDVFSAGVVAHELLTAHPLFSAKTDYDTLIRIHEAEIPPPSRRNPGIPASLDELVLTALARDPERRLQSAGAFRQGIDFVAEQTGVRFSARDVTEWRAKIATADDPWGSRSSLPSASPAGSSRSFSFPESRNSSSLPNLNQRALSEFTGMRQAAGEPRASRGLSAADPTASPTPTRPSSDDEHAVADLTWGSEVGGGGPLHPIPDHSELDSHSASLPAPAPPPIGASFPTARSSRPQSIARLALVLLGSVAAVLAVYQFVLRPKKPAAPPPAPVVTAIRFVVQPADAVVEVGGKEVGHQSPFDSQLGAGLYSIRVRKDGYKPWTREVTLREGDHPTIQVALDPGTALLSVTSQPPGLPVQLDGKQLDQVTPVDLPISAGTHALVVTNTAGATWSQNFTAEVDGKYSYVAPLASNKRTGAAAAAVAVTRPSAPAAPDRNEKVDRNDRPDRSDRNKRTGNAPTRVAGKDIDAELRLPEPTPEPPVAKPEPVAPAPAPSPPPDARPRPAPAPPPTPVTARTTPLVAPTAVTKLSGELPAMRVSGVTEASTDVVAKLCIDDQGRVASVRIVKAMAQITDELQRSLSGWRYRPYTNKEGQASPACFPVTMRVVFKRD